jgi:hypothetical protein
MAAGWYQTARCSTWEGIQKIVLHRFADPGVRWIFRGHRDAGWALVSSLERVAHQRFGKPMADLAYIEWRLRRTFERSLHRFASRVPRRDDTMEWWALMQHHGAPTRLIDWTYSFYVALFFALEHAEPNETCAVWAVDQNWLMQTLHASRSAAVRRALDFDPSLKTPEAVNVLVEAAPAAVAPLVPYFLNERLAIQQGVFLAPLDVSRSFMANLRAMAKPAELRKHVFKIEVRSRHFGYLLAWLNRLNVNRLSLFPGIDGLASDLAAKVAWMPPAKPEATWKHERAVQQGPSALPDTEPPVSARIGPRSPRPAPPRRSGGGTSRSS